MNKELQQGSPEWLAMRRDYIGGSDAPIIMQVSPFSTPHKLWLNKLGLYEVEETESMRRGKRLEEEVREKMSQELECNFQPKVMFSEDYPFMMASLDGWSESNIEALEIKCPNKEDHDLAKKMQVPLKYKYQLWHIIECCELDYVWYASYHNNDLTYFRFLRDDNEIKKMLVEEQKFYDKMINFIEPELTDRDYVQRIDEAWVSTAIKYRSTKARLKVLEQEEKDLRQELLLLANGTPSAGGTLRLSAHMRRGVIDYSRIPLPENFDLDSLRGPAKEIWRISDE